MTGRECVHNILNRRPTDRLSWKTLADPATLSAMPEPERSMSPLDFYGRIGADVLQFGNYGLPKEVCVPSPAKPVWEGVRVETCRSPDGARTDRTVTRWGELTAVTRNGHPVKHRVESVADLRVLRNMWEAMTYEEVDGHEEGFRRAEALIGDRGAYVPTLQPSPVQQLIEVDMGQVNFYYLLQDAPEEMQGLLDAMHERRKWEYEIVTRRTPAEVVIPVENTSSTLTSPAVYERFSLPQMSDYVNIAHRNGKKIVFHMCGCLKALLPIIRRTGLDGYNAMTPPTVGDTSFEYALDILGEDTVILGGVLDPTVFQMAGLTRDELRRALDEVYTPRVRRAHLMLWLGADGLPTPLDRFLWVREWMEENGKL